MNENTELHFILNKSKAASKNAVEPKSSLAFPENFLYLFSSINPSTNESQPAKIEKLQCLHMFESTPQTKIAVALTLLRANETRQNIVAIFGVAITKVTMILLVNDEVTQMCTAGDAESLIVGTK